MRQHTYFENYHAQTPSQQAAAKLLSTYARGVVDHVKEKGEPTNSSRMVILHGKPGCGKSHLLEAFHKFLEENGVNDQIFWIHRDLALDFPVMAPVFIREKPIVIIDDLFQNENHAKENELRKLCELILMAYQRRVLLIIATNLPAAAFMPQIMASDDHGRIASRVNEMTRNGENVLHIDGPDGRQAATSLL